MGKEETSSQIRQAKICASATNDIRFPPSGDVVLLNVECTNSGDVVLLNVECISILCLPTDTTNLNPKLLPKVILLTE